MLFGQGLNTSIIPHMRGRIYSGSGHRSGVVSPPSRPKNILLGPKRICQREILCSGTACVKSCARVPLVTRTTPKAGLTEDAARGRAAKAHGESAGGSAENHRCDQTKGVVDSSSNRDVRGYIADVWGTMTSRHALTYASGRCMHSVKGFALVVHNICLPCLLLASCRDMWEVNQSSKNKRGTTTTFVKRGTQRKTQ